MQTCLIVLFDYENRRLVGSFEQPALGTGRKVVKMLESREGSFEECEFEYTTAVKVNPQTLLLLAKQMTGPPLQLDYVHAES